MVPYAAPKREKSSPAPGEGAAALAMPGARPCGSGKPQRVGGQDFRGRGAAGCLA